MAVHAALPSLAARLLALLAGGACVLALRHYPLDHGWPCLLFAVLLPAYFLLLCWRPASWLFCLPALLPVLDLAPWTGWFFIEEIDLLLLLTVACGYWRLARQKAAASARLSSAAWLWLLLCSLAWLTALLRGLLPLPPLDANAWDNYLSSYNSVRLGKAWAWSLLLLPLLLRDGGADGLRRYAMPGMLAGLAMVALCALWERAVFPGLLNFSSDYRITAPFSAMHTGGAALDGYLALSLPFAALWLARPAARWQTAPALFLLGLALHAAFTTFSRGLYAAMLAALVAAGALLLAARPATAWRLPRPRTVLGLLLAAAGAVLLVHLFGIAGYRGLAAAVVLLGATFVLATQPLPWRLAPACLLCALAVQGVLAGIWPDLTGAPGWLKAPYALFLLSAVLLSALLLRGPLRPAARAAATPARLGLAMMAWVMLACNAVWIGWHWAGTPALLPAALAVLLATVMLGNGHLRPPLWQLGRHSLGVAGTAGMLLLLAIPVSASYYANERFASSAGDLQGRLRHWQQVLSMRPPDMATSLFGMGSGTFPATYYWHNPLREVPASIRYASEGGDQYVRLASPGYSAGYGELLRLLQRVPVRPDTRYLLSLDARRAGAMPLLQVRLCQRQLLYAQNCVIAPLRLRAVPPAAPATPATPATTVTPATPVAPAALAARGASAAPAVAAHAWQHYALPLASGPLGAGDWLLRAPVQLELAASGAAQSTVIDVDNLSLRGPGGEELLANGQFSQANHAWFFSSDHHHLPWHIKNLALHLLVETGWCGVLSTVGLLILAALRLLDGARQGRVGAIALGAALAGFLAVGIFDSLLDVPRIALLFHLLLLGALLQAPGGATSSRAPSFAPTRTPPTESPP